MFQRVTFTRFCLVNNDSFVRMRAILVPSYSSPSSQSSSFLREKRKGFLIQWVRITRPPPPRAPPRSPSVLQGRSLHVLDLFIVDYGHNVLYLLRFGRQFGRFLFIAPVVCTASAFFDLFSWSRTSTRLPILHWVIHS